MKIKSTHKKRSKLLMDNKRGLFRTNILSKLYEKVLDLRTTEKVKIRLEEDNKFRFSRKKSKYMVIKSGKGKVEEIKKSVKEGIIKRTDKYKYLGWWFCEANHIRRQLHE